MLKRYPTILGKQISQPSATSARTLTETVKMFIIVLWKREICASCIFHSIYVVNSIILRLCLPGILRAILSPAKKDGQIHWLINRKKALCQFAKRFFSVIQRSIPAPEGGKNFVTEFFTRFRESGNGDGIRHVRSFVVIRFVGKQIHFQILQYTGKSDMFHIRNLHIGILLLWSQKPAVNFWHCLPQP